MSGKHKNRPRRAPPVDTTATVSFAEQPAPERGLTFKPFPPIEARKCKACGADICFGYTPQGAPIAYDPEPLEVVWPCRNSITIKRDVYREHACSRAHRLSLPKEPTP